MFIMGKALRMEGEETCGKSLQLTLKFIVTLRLLLKIKTIEKQQQIKLSNLFLDLSKLNGQNILSLSCPSYVILLQKIFFLNKKFQSVTMKFFIEKSGYKMLKISLMQFHSKKFHLTFKKKRFPKTQMIQRE